MKIRAIAVSTFGTLVRNRAIVLICAVFLCVLLLSVTVLRFTPRNTALAMVAAIMWMVSGFGSLLAAWSAADAVASEMKSGTILAVMARPVRRWEFLLGKYLGVQLPMLVHIALMVATSYALAAIGGVRVHAGVWILIAYPLVRYAIYSALAMWLVTVMHPMVAFAIVLITPVASSFVMPGSRPGLLPDAFLNLRSRFLLLIAN